MSDLLELPGLHGGEIVREALGEDRRRSVDPRVPIDLREVRNNLGFQSKSRRRRRSRLDRSGLVGRDDVIDRFVGEPRAEPPSGTKKARCGCKRSVRLPRGLLDLEDVLV